MNGHKKVLKVLSEFSSFFVKYSNLKNNYKIEKLLLLSNVTISPGQSGKMATVFMGETAIKFNVLFNFVFEIKYFLQISMCGLKSTELEKSTRLFFIT